jgi:acetyl esterase
MYMDPQVKSFLDMWNAQQSQAQEAPTVESARQGFSDLFKTIGGPSRPVYKTQEIQIPGPRGDVRCLVYTPRASSEPLPVLIFYHGGGCCFLSPDDYEASSTALAIEADCIVVAPDYRLAPENPFPAPLEDCYAVLTWLQANAGQIGGDSKAIAIAGDSGGGYLTAAVALEAKRLGTPQPIYQILIYPQIDMAGRSASRVDIEYFINDAVLEWVIEMHAGTNRLDPRASPIHAADLSGLAPAMVVAAEHDPLVDEGKAYTNKLRKFGVPTTYHLYEGMIHGFFNMGGAIDAGNQAVQHVAGALRHAFQKARAESKVADMVG